MSENPMSGHGEGPGGQPTLREEIARLRAFLQRLGATAWLGAVAACLPPLGSIVLFYFMNTVGMWLRSHGHEGVALYIAGFALLSGVALLPTYASAILGGWSFGFAVGFPAALLGFVGGSLIGYEIARRVSGDRVVKMIEEKPKWKAVYDALAPQHGRVEHPARSRGFFKTLGIVALVRLPPNSPFALTNLLLASVQVPRLTFALGTLIGMAPRTGLVVYVASFLQNMTAAEAGQAEKPWWWIPLGIGMTLVILGILGYIANRAIERMTRSEAQAPGEAGTPR